MTPLSDRAVAHLREVADWPDLSGSRYEVLAPIGRGGMGTVFRTRDLVLEREVALKVLSHHVTDREIAQRLRQEALILARLEHPGIVPVYDAGVLNDGRPFYVMKLVEGERLDGYLGRTGSLGERLGLFQRLCEAVAFAHSHGVIHRDLKPENVMIGPFGEVLVMDWGVAKLRERLESARGTAGEASSAEGEGRAEGDTAAGTVLGTPGFMAPEQEAGRPDLVDERTDVFALGALLRRLLSGIETPKPLEAVIRKATTPDPAARYAGAAAVAEDVRRFLDARAVEAYPEGPLERGARIFRKYGTAILLVLAYLAMRVLFILLR